MPSELTVLDTLRRFSGHADSRLRVVEAVAEDEHRALTLRECPERTGECLAAERDLDLLVGLDRHDVRLTDTALDVVRLDDLAGVWPADDPDVATLGDVPLDRSPDVAQRVGPPAHWARRFVRMFETPM